MAPLERLLGTSMDITEGTVRELDSWPISPPKGDSEVNVGVEPSFPEAVAEMAEAPRLPKITLAFVAIMAAEAEVWIAIVLCSPPAVVEEPSKPVSTVVILFPMMVMDDSEPYPGGTPDEGPLGYGNLVT